MIPTIHQKFETNLEQNCFSIDEEQSGFIISMLRNNIYANPLLNSMKETLSNALDEHSKHQVTKPIDICLPNSFSTSLSIRDYAKGISKEYMLSDYTKVGKSTKSHNNDVLGGLGIGRMSPLAYADMYLVTSITVDDWDNVKRKREYVVSKDNHKVFCSMLLEDETDEDTGVLVSFDIKQEDYKTISEYVYDNIKYLCDVSVSINGVLYEPEKPTHTYKSFKVFNKQHGPSLIGLIGGLPNTIDLCNFNNDTTNTVIQFINSRTCHRNCLVFDIEIGQVDQSADKNIQLSTRTKQYIGQKLSQIYKDFVEFINNEISTVTSWCDIVEFMNKFNISTYNTTDYMWKGKTILLDSWLKNNYSYKTITNKKDGSDSYRCKHYAETYHGESYNSKKTYYYNDLSYVPRTDVLFRSGIGDLDNIVLVNGIDNTYYDLPLLSSFLPKDIIVKTRNVNTKVSVNKKCYKMSKHHGELGRQVNIDLDKRVPFITREFYNKYVNSSVRDKLFNYVNSDIYIVEDGGYVNGHWIDLHNEFIDMFAGINANTYNNYHNVCGGRSFYSSITNKLLFVDDNPTHIISKVFTTMKVFIDAYLQHHSLIQTLVNNNIIELEEEPTTYCIKQACDDIELMYPMLNGGRYMTTISEELVLLYIKQVDMYNKV